MRLTLGSDSQTKLAAALLFAAGSEPEPQQHEILETEANDNDLSAGFWVGEWLAEPTLNRISRDGDDVAVEPKVMEVLVCLASHPGRAVTKDHFFETLWEGMVVTDDSLSRCISELRKHFGDDSRDPRYIETIRKTGYRLLAPVTLREDSAPDFRRRMPSLDGAAPKHAERSVNGNREDAPAPRRPRSAFVVAILVAVAALLLWMQTRETGSPDPLVPVTTPFTSLPGLEIDPAFSPDGRRIAFASDDNGQRNFDIYIKQEGSETILRITDDTADERFPSWSPDGLFLAFVRLGAGSSAVYTIPSLGGQERKIADFGSRRVQGVSWSPDGSQLAVSAQREPFGAFSIFLVGVDTAHVRRITSPPKSDYGDVTPAFSPDGKALAFARGISDDVQDIFVYFFDTNEARQVTHDSVTVAGVDWLPDAKSIVFASHRRHASGIWSVKVDGGEAVGLASAGPGTNYEHPSLSADGSRLTYAQRTASVNIWRLYKPEGFPGLRARPAVFSTHWDSYPDIAPAGDRIAFASTQSGQREIWVSDADGKNPAQLTSGGGRAKAPRWSPDGSELAFQWRKDGQADIYVIGAEGGAPRRVTVSPFEDTNPTWSRNADFIYFTSNRSGGWEIWRKSAQGGPAEQITKNGGKFSMESDDGESIYYVRPDTDGIWNYPLDGSAEPRMVFANLDGRDWGNWSVTPSGIYFVQRLEHSPALAFYGFQSGRTTHLKTLDSVPSHPALSVSKDLSWFVYTQIDDEGSDIMVLEGFR